MSIRNISFRWSLLSSRPVNGRYLLVSYLLVAALLTCFEQFKPNSLKVRPVLVKILKRGKQFKREMREFVPVLR